jgi:hypothetical protein
VAVRLVNRNPLGAVDLPLLGLCLDANEEFDCPDDLAGTAPSGDDLGSGLLAQVGNYALVPPPPTPAPTTTKNTEA